MFVYFTSYIYSCIKSFKTAMLLQLHCKNKAHYQTIHRKFEIALLQYNNNCNYDKINLLMNVLKLVP